MLKVAWHEKYCHPLPEGHRFPMAKYNLLPELLLFEGTIGYDNLFYPSHSPEIDIHSSHSPVYWSKLKSMDLSPQEIRKTGFPLSHALVERESIIMNGTTLAAQYAMENGISMNIAGGTHHAFYDRGEGFCLLNDLAIAANYLINNRLADRILIIDLDVHQGNGTAAIFSNRKDVFTFSMHGEKNYPLQKEISSLDVPLPDGIADFAYLELLRKNLDNILAAFPPDFILYQCGVDVLETDKLGRLNLSQNGCKQRDAIVFELAKNNKIPIACAMGGGYSQNISDIVEAHANTFRLAQEIFF